MNSEVASNAQVLLIHSYITVMAISLLAYDHMITSAEEIAYIWRQPKRVSSFLFLLNRYGGALGNIVTTSVSFVSLSTETCTKYTLFRQSLLLESQVVICTILTLRTFAVYGRDKRVIAFMVTFGMCLAGGVIWALIGQHVYHPPGAPGCLLGYDTTTAIHLAAAWEALVLYDSLVFFLTLRKTYKTGLRSGIFSPDKKLNIVALVCRDGAIYYAAMVLANLANILSYYIAPSLMRGGLSTFSSCISITLVSRLMLNLHETADIGILSTHVPQRFESDAPTFTTHLDSHCPSLTDDVP